jgi:hypothetical protein
MRRLKKVFKWTAICVAVLIAVLLIANAYFVWSTGTALERRLAELRAAGEPVQLSDLVREPTSPERDAGIPLRRAEGDLEAMQNELATLYPRMLLPKGVLSPADREKLRKVFDAYPRVIPLLEQAAACPDYVPQIQGTSATSQFLQPNMDRITKHRVLARVLRARTTLLAAEGRPDDAVANTTLALRIARHWLREPLIIGYLVTLACQDVAVDGLNEGLRAGPVSPAARQALDAELALHDSLDGLRWALRTERSFSLASVREFPNAQLWISRGFSNKLQLSFLDAFDQEIARTEIPYPELMNRKAKPGGDGGLLNPLKALVNLLGPALDSARVAAERARATSRCLRVLNALQTREAAIGDQPPKLSDLRLPPQATIDPYNGEPLHVRKSSEGWIVYSVGTNLVDDEGSLEDRRDVGLGPVRKEPPAMKK